MDITQLTIDPEFSQCQRRLTPDEFSQLERNIIEDGEVLSPIAVWKGTTLIVDGEHRQKVASKHPSIPFAIKEMEFESREAIVTWITNHQTGRRNLDGIALTMQRAKAARETKDVEGVAKQYGVAKRTIFRDEECQKALESMPDDQQDRIKRGELVASPADLRRFGRLSETEQTKVVNDLKADPTKMLGQAIAPPLKKTSLTDDDMGIVAETFSPSINKRIAQGTLPASHAEIQRVAKLPDELKQTVDDLLTSNEVASISEAIDNLPKNLKKPKQTVDVGALKAKAVDLIEKLTRAVDDLARATGKDASTCIDHLKMVNSSLPC